MDPETIEKYFMRHRIVAYMLLGLSAFILVLIVFLSRQLSSQEAMTTASQASELITNQGGSDSNGDGNQASSNSTSGQQGQSCPLSGTYKGIFTGESQESDCFSINYCTYSPCGYKNVSYTCLRRQDTRGRQIRRTLGNTCQANPVEQVARLCGCAVAPTAIPSPTVTPSPTAVPPQVVPPTQSAPSVSCSGNFTGSGGDTNYCMQSSGQTSVRYATLKCLKNGVSSQKQVNCQSIGRGMSCCNLSDFTQPWADYHCGCTTSHP